MDPLAAVGVIVIVLFVLAFLAIAVYAVRQGRPDATRRLRGGSAIQDSIVTYDRRQRRNWYGRFWR
jgi:uncharacterized membrane protein